MSLIFRRSNHRTFKWQRGLKIYGNGLKKLLKAIKCNIFDKYFLWNRGKVKLAASSECKDGMEYTE